MINVLGSAGRKAESSFFCIRSASSQGAEEKRLAKNGNVTSLLPWSAEEFSCWFLVCAHGASGRITIARAPAGEQAGLVF